MLPETILIFVSLMVHVQSDAPVAPTPAPAPVTPACPAPPNPDIPSIKVDEFQVFDDCKTLCDEVTSKFFKNPKTITKLLCHRTFAQRDQIQKTFPEKCDNRVLVDKINSITFMLSDCKKLMAALLTSPAQLNKQAIEGEKNENHEDDVITLIMCSATNKDKADLAKEYCELQKVLEDYGGKGGAGYKDVLINICAKQRKETPDPNVTPQNIECAANELITLNGPDFVAKLKELFGKYGDPELQKIFIKYSEIKADSDIADKIKDSFQGKEQQAWMVLTRSIQNKYMFYAKALNHCIKGGEFESNLKCVNRIVVIRCEIDLGNIAQNYEHLFGVKFVKDFRDSVKIDKEYHESICKLFGNYE